MMTSDADWVEDVKRWYFSAASSLAAASNEPASTDYGADVGYEAAHPTLQACHWPAAAALTDR